MIGHFRWITILFSFLFVYYATSQKLASEVLEEMTELFGTRSFMHNSHNNGWCSCLQYKAGVLTETKKFPIAVSNTGFTFYFTMQGRYNGSYGFITLEVDNGKQSNEHTLRFDWDRKEQRYQIIWNGDIISDNKVNGHMNFSYYPNGKLHGRPLGMWPLVEPYPSIDDAIPFNSTHKILWLKLTFQMKYRDCFLFPVKTSHFLEWDPTTTPVPTTTTETTTILTTTTTAKPKKAKTEPILYVLFALIPISLIGLALAIAFIIYNIIKWPRKPKAGQVASGQPGPAKTPSSGDPAQVKTESMQLGSQMASNKSVIQSVHTSPNSVKPEKPEKPEGSTVDEYLVAP